jgi:hypothetical protein
VLDLGEACDDGNDSNFDACTNGCRPARCGDGFLRAGLALGAPGFEECDGDGSAVIDYCRSDCRKGPRPRRVAVTETAGALLRDGVVMRWGSGWGEQESLDFPPTIVIAPTPLTLFARPAALFSAMIGLIFVDQEDFRYAISFMTDSPRYGQSALQQLGDRTLGYAKGPIASCTIDYDGRLRCSGGNCGQNEYSPQAGEPSLIEGQAVRGVAVALGSVCAALVDGRVSCWGDLTEWGADIETCEATPPTIQPGVDEVVALVADRRGYAALRADGSVLRWGAVVRGLRDGEMQRRIEPPGQVELPGPALSLASAKATICAVLVDQTVACWGRLAARPVDGAARQVPGFEGVVEVSTAPLAPHLCGRKHDESVWCWGDNADQQLGDGTTERRMLPVRVQGL